MLEFLRNYNGKIYVNDALIDNKELPDIIANTSKELKIHLEPNIPDKPVQKDPEYLIHVKGWMLNKSNNGFDFMKTWNNDIPMPLKVMAGTVLEETKGMYKMALHGVPMNTDTCMRCGRPLSNPISRVYGIGPECMENAGIPRELCLEEAQSRIAEIEQAIKNITWTGYIAKTAIVDVEEL